MNLSFGVKVLVVLLCISISAIVGIVAGLIKHTPATAKGPAILYGGGTFGGALTLCMLVLTSLGVL
ncbi:hypothetical protein ACLB9X_11815 [Streptomyces sp. 5K101]|uniref:hypothetical protein n=1 Tax=Streptomyces sp. 5K101 TaxID=3390037 RepID=UPI003974DEEF